MSRRKPIISQTGQETLYIERAAFWENGYIESVVGEGEGEGEPLRRGHLYSSGPFYPIGEADIRRKRAPQSRNHHANPIQSIFPS